MRSNLTTKVAETMKQYAMLGDRPSDARILAAVSGGPDSVALFWILRGLAAEIGFSLAIAHLDHGLRGDEGAADRSFVEDLARRAAVPCLTEKVELTDRGGNREGRARKERYRFLRRAAAIMGCNRIATGHTLNDQAETVLMRILAGAGQFGLRGIRPVNATVIRPLLSSSRQDIWHFLQGHKYSWRRDVTNYDVSLVRNRVRHLALPFLAGMFNRRLVQALARTAELAASDEEALEGICRAASDRVAASDNRVKVKPLVELPVSVQQRLVRQWVVSRGARRPTARQIEKVIELAARGGAAGRVSLGGVTIAYELGFLTAGCDRGGREEPVSYHYSITPGSEISVKEAGVVLNLSGMMRAGDAPAPGKEVCVADASLLPPALTIRNRRPGDRLLPLGMSGSKELKEVFREARVPRHLRALVPIVCAREEILWIPGVARSRVAAVTPATKWVILARVRRH